MAIHVSSNSKGFTLIEFLVAIVILMVGLLGLLQTVNYAIVHNMGNQLRQEALMLADERMNTEKARSYDMIDVVQRSFSTSRLVNGAFRSYSVSQNVTEPTSRTKQIELQIIWRYKGERYTHSVLSLISEFE
jgi:type IV pilus assembly protein PilV